MQSSYGIKYKLWLEQYSSEKLMKIRYDLLNCAAWDDWIIHADRCSFLNIVKVCLLGFDVQYPLK